MQSILSCHQGYQLYGALNEEQQENTKSRYLPPLVFILTVILYLQLLGLILVDNVDFGVWGDIVGWIKILSEFFSANVFINNGTMAIAVPLIFCAIQFILCSPIFEGNACLIKTNVVFAPKKRNILLKIMAGSFFLFLVGLLLFLVLPDLAFFVVSFSVTVFYLTLVWGKRRGIFTLTLRNLYRLHFVLYIPLSVLIGEAILIRSVADDDTEDVGGIIIFSLILCIINFIFYCDFCILDASCYSDKEIDNSDRVGDTAYMLNLLFVVEAFVMAFFSSILGDAEYQEDGGLVSEIGDEERAKLPLYCFLPVLGLSALLLIVFRPFYDSAENQAHIFIRLSHLFLVCTLLMQTEISEPLFQLLLFFISIVTFSYFSFICNPASFWEVKNNLLSDKYLTEESWGKMETNDKANYLRHFYKIGDIETIEKYDLQNFHASLPEFGFHALVGMSDFTCMIKSEADCLALFQEDISSIFQSLEVLCVNVEGSRLPYGSIFRSIMQILPIIENLSRLTLILQTYSVEDYQSWYDCLPGFSSLNSLQRLVLYCKENSRVFGDNGEANLLIENLPRSLEHIEIYHARITLSSEKHKERLLTINTVIIPWNHIPEDTLIELIKRAGDPDSKIQDLVFFPQMNAGNYIGFTEELYNEIEAVSDSKPDLNIPTTLAMDYARNIYETYEMPESWEESYLHKMR